MSVLNDIKAYIIAITKKKYGEADYKVDWDNRLVTGKGTTYKIIVVDDNLTHVRVEK